ncbi:MAG: hypothetical protein U0X93_16340 [Anaerolineales bacterium]
MQRTLEIAKVINKVKLSDKKADSAYWRTQPYSARLAALEEIRREYHGEELPMQKIVTIVRMKHDNS